MLFFGRNHETSSSGNNFWTWSQWQPGQMRANAGHQMEDGNNNLWKFREIIFRNKLLVDFSRSRIFSNGETVFLQRLRRRCFIRSFYAEDNSWIEVHPFFPNPYFFSKSINWEKIAQKLNDFRSDTQNPYSAFLLLLYLFKIYVTIISRPWFAQM